ncbi:ArsR/SmtB family transcription factor [Emcibacter nanhaiensis]|uniref:Winged helix-turn-helix transcriptional regulator n=1 Tax=Emcibacter nanhaiensis TaxID=1505037 RepID=A0A501PNN1_9PROT|nr:metalloregulator ArsR/SmtB family transcription factor [Emcibacter nanhaiensis]TPD61727.1 winged helix-turn-helix transcriptional regulator [Emcibacter nanhaiensis]
MSETQALEKLRDRADEISALLKVLSHPNRLLIACELMEGERSVSEIEQNTGVKQPGLSRELARLREQGLVSTTRESKAVFYRLADERLSDLVSALCVSCAEGKCIPPAFEQTYKASQAAKKNAAEFASVGRKAPARRSGRLRINPDPYRKD